MAEFINSEIKYVALGEATGVTLPPPIATVKFDVRIPGRFTIDVNEDGSWTYVRERYDEEWRRKHFEVSYNQGFLDGWKTHKRINKNGRKIYRNRKESSYNDVWRC